MNPGAWHAGERALQERAGVADRMADVGARVLRDFMPDQHREFFAQLPFLLAATLDGDGYPAASVLAGPPGFARSPEPRLLRVDAPCAEGVREGDPVALLGLEAHTGRRNRMNGWIVAPDHAGFSVRVGQSFGNCPKYIHPREAIHAPAALPADPRPWETADLEMVAAADTFFIATAHPGAREGNDPARGLDISHRGGPAGFVQVRDGALLVPDFTGNSFFNTLGNLQLEPRCALLFIDYRTGERLHLRARGEVLWGSPRLLRLEIIDGARTRGGLPLRWEER